MRLLVLIPSYNTGAALLCSTVEGALEQWPDVWVIVDGSTDGSGSALAAKLAGRPGFRLIVRAENRGKGAAVLHGAKLAAEAGFTHILAMDADGQHPAQYIQRFAKLADQYPEAMLLGCPQFGPEAPQLRVQGRKISNAWTNLETLN